MTTSPSSASAATTGSTPGTTSGGGGFLEELRWRGLLYQCTDEANLREHLKTPGRIGYCGFDPTAESLTIGNLIPLRMLMAFQAAGHTPIILFGGGTGRIGDPSGKDEERQLLDEERVEANIQRQRAIIERLFDTDPNSPNRAVIVDNWDWLKDLSFIQVLREIGKHFSVNAMIQKESIRHRLEEREHGISYTEFSYVLLQAYDFLHLSNTMNCTVQMAGSDQYGNIVSGVDLIHREHGHEAPAFGVTAPLVTRADGKKIGKTEKGAVWLSAEKTSPYAFYQFWINTDDADVANYLKWYTPLGREAIEEVLTRHQEAPHQREAQRTLAQQVTAMIHGEAEMRRAEHASRALFSGEVRQLDEPTLREVFADVPSSTHDKAALEGEGVSLVELLPQTSLAQSKREAREFLGNGAVSVNGQRVEADHHVTMKDLLHGEIILLRRGKKKWHATMWR